MFIKGPNPTPVWELNLVDLKGSGVLFFHVIRVPTPLGELNVSSKPVLYCTGKRAERPERVLLSSSGSTAAADHGSHVLLITEHLAVYSPQLFQYGKR